MPTHRRIPSCPPKDPLKQRALIAKAGAKELAELFSLLANDTRLRILHAIIRETEVCVSDIAEAVGMKPQAVSNQLQKMVLRRVLGSERRGNQIFYSVIDPCVIELLDRGHCLALDSRKRHG